MFVVRDGDQIPEVGTKGNGDGRPREGTGAQQQGAQQEGAEARGVKREAAAEGASKGLLSVGAEQRSAGHDIRIAVWFLRLRRWAWMGGARSASWWVLREWGTGDGWRCTLPLLAKTERYARFAQTSGSLAGVGQPSRFGPVDASTIGAAVVDGLGGLDWTSWRIRGKAGARDHPRQQSSRRQE
ncbi:hypothetical protein BS50DRAFT_579949 [Corynespora cassiicola Philippines]|uniref:Uncharacterized protein n=1 Tax=Corynespora cassiicola Philippines TaxID=1448308 RepID=A0A2T2N2T1_CORCC|nr:hypothetical protein BS50DRAFT_579949 [Corynespora cassiicola Philippines]